MSKRGSEEAADSWKFAEYFLDGYSRALIYERFSLLHPIQSYID
jgi:hypothetical protein